MRKVAFLVGSISWVALAGCGGAAADGSDELLGSDPSNLSGHTPACPGPVASDSARCHSHVRNDAGGSSGPTGLAPADLQSAYKLPSSTAGSGRLVAIVDAFDYPQAESDLATYRAQFALPPCTTANGCFRKVNQDGATGPFPRADSGWDLEMALDLDMVSATCPNCRILLVEANSSSLANLGAAVNTAVGLGANVVSNSYGGNEFSSEASQETTFFDHPGVAITVSSGDNGFGVEFPAASQFVTAVGGTTLNRASNARGWTETTWSGAGSGCSQFITKPAWQSDPGCARRTVADVSAVADPNTGVSVFDSHGFHGKRGWFVVGGTSASAPIIGGVYALAGNSVTAGSFPYAHPSSLFDVVSGSNGSCGGSYLCTAVAGYDGPTGLGTPNGTGSF
jgi:subtilase family serine protease